MFGDSDDTFDAAECLIVSVSGAFRTIDVSAATRSIFPVDDVRADLHDGDYGDCFSI